MCILDFRMLSVSYAFNCSPLFCSVMWLDLRTKFCLLVKFRFLKIATFFFFFFFNPCMSELAMFYFSLLCFF